MPNCDFYACDDDFRLVLDFVFKEPDWVLHELYSGYDTPVVRYTATKDVLADCPVGINSVHFQLYSPEMKGLVVHRRIDFKPGAIAGATHRFTTEGWGLIQLYFGSLRSDGLTPSHTNHNSEARARTWSGAGDAGPLGDPTAWDWRAVSRISGRINRYLRSVAPSKMGARPVLPSAHDAVSAGRMKLLLVG